MELPSTSKQRRRSRPNRRPANGVVSKQSVRQMIDSRLSEREEHKYAASSETSTGFDYSGLLSDLTAIAQGSTDTTRVGDRIRLDSLHFSFYFTAGDTTNLCRIVLFQWFPPSGSFAPVIGTNLFLTTGSILAPISQYLVDFESNFRVLYDKLFYLSTTVTQSGTIQHIDVRKFPQRNLQYVAGGTSGSGHLYRLVISDSAAVPNPTICSTWLVRFTDD